MRNAAHAFATEQLERLPIDKIPVANPVANVWQCRVNKFETSAYSEVRLNANGYVNVIGVDLDVGWNGLANPDRYSQAVVRCLDAIKPPNLIMMSENGRAHACYWMESPRYVGKSSSVGVQKFVRDITRRVRVSLGGDPSYNNRFIHNPFSDEYAAHLICAKPYDWGDLAELPFVADMSAANASMDEASAAAKGRNSHIHWLTVQTACRNWIRRYDSDFPGLVLGWAMGWNEQHYGDRPLGLKELQRTAKSVTKFVREKFTPKVSTRPFRPFRYQRTKFVLEFSPDQNQHERQRAGALYVADLKRSRTETIIREARIRLGSSASQKQIVAQTGLSLRTVKSYWH